MTENEKRARIFKAFCDPNRLAILEILQDGEHCACDLLARLKIGQPTLSHHMRILLDAEIVTVRKDGKWMHYSLYKHGIKTAKDILAQITASRKKTELSA